MTKTAQHSEHAAHDATGKFWKALLHKAYEIVDKVMKLLTSSNFGKLLTTFPLHKVFCFLSNHNDF